VVTSTGVFGSAAVLVAPRVMLDANGGPNAL
jgi:hypothetical protein